MVVDLDGDHPCRLDVDGGQQRGGFAVNAEIIAGIVLLLGVIAEGLRRKWKRQDAEKETERLLDEINTTRRDDAWKSGNPHGLFNSKKK
jgi:hypothetical protein